MTWIEQFVCVVCHGWSTYDYIMHEREANGLAVEDGNAGKTRRAGRWRHVSGKIRGMYR